MAANPPMTTVQFPKPLMERLKKHIETLPTDKQVAPRLFIEAAVDEKLAKAKR